MLLALLIAAQTWGPHRLPPVLEAEDPLVDAAGIVRDLIVDLAYATSDNITGRALYPTGAKCLLRRSVAERLARAAAPLPEGAAREHREALKSAMHAAGFRVNPKEWWHYSRLYGWRWPVAISR